MRIFEHGTFRFLAVNDAAVKLYGYTREEFLAMTAKDTRHPEELDDFLTTLDEPTGYFRHRGPRRHVRKNGEVIVVEAVTQDIQFNGRKARLSMNIDVTERKRIEQVLRENEARFSGVVESAMDAIISVDSTLHIVLFNAAAERMFGYPAAEIVGQPLDRLIPARYHEVHRSHIRSFGETGATARSIGKLGDISGLRASGEEFSAEASISQLEIGGEKLFTVILRDVTERKVVERALHESESKYRSLVESSSDLI